jgi:hypothetical protein
MTPASLLNWTELAKAPEAPGIYAWYFRPELTDFDIRALAAEIADLSGDQARTEKVRRIKLFLHKRIFRYFEQKPYFVELKGSLKPRYKGEVAHSPDEDLSNELVKRLAEEPLELFELRTCLESTTPLFASPIYIGMAENLRNRLVTHKRLMIALGETATLNTLNYANFELTTSEINFAERITERNIPTSRLFVATEKVEKVETAKNIENLLNRIYFPILGRN